MFKLGYSIDDTVEIDGKTYELDMSFDNILRFYEMMNDNELSNFEQIHTGMYMLFSREFDYDIQTLHDILKEVVEKKLVSEDNNNKLVDITGKEMDVSKLKPKMSEEDEDDKKVYDLKQDAQYIYASFMQDYGMDLFEYHGKLHWYKFQALLSGLSDETKFKKVIEIRTMKLPTGKGTSNQREEIKKMKKIYALKPE